jgi:two-component system chemotaxis response regulator CheB
MPAKRPQPPPRPQPQQRQQTKIRVLVVDDSMVARSLIMQGLSAHPRIEVVGYAINAMDARRAIAHYKPDVVTLDVEMPGMSGIEFLKQYMPVHPMPVILVSSLDLRVFDALHAGAVDFVRKPDHPKGNGPFIASLAQKVIMAANAHVRPAMANGGMNAPGGVALLGNRAGLDRIIIGLGASTGGTEATYEVMRHLPADIPPMVVVQHMPAGFTKLYADRLQRECPMEVREGRDGDILHRGLALIAPAGLQTRVVQDGMHYKLSCVEGERISGHCPSVDALFQSMAENVLCKKVGIIMTGMGRDGAAGLLDMHQKGAFTIGQDEATSIVYGMPKVAFEIGAVQAQAPLEKISELLLGYLRNLA